MSQASTYHHGDLRAACLRAARELLEEDGSAGLSLRAVARRAGVSATAPTATSPTATLSSLRWPPRGTTSSPDT